MNIEKKLLKYRGLQLLSQVGSGSFIFEDVSSFYSLQSVQEAVTLTLEMGVLSAIEFNEPLIALKKQRAISLNIYFKIREGAIVYVGLTPDDVSSEDVNRKVQSSLSATTHSQKRNSIFKRAIFSFFTIFLMLGLIVYIYNPQLNDVLNKIYSFFMNQNVYEQNIKDANWENLEEGKQNQVLQWLAIADTLFQEGHFIDARGTGALNFYERVLEYHHSNRIAIQRREKIYAWLTQKTQNLLHENKIDSAKYLLEIGKKHFKNSMLLRELAQRIMEREQYLKMKGLLTLNNLDEVAYLLSRIPRERVLDDSLKTMWIQIGKAYLAEGARYLEAGDLAACRQNLEKAQKYLGENDVALQLSFKALERAERAEQERLIAEQQAREIKARLESDQLLARGISFFNKVVLDKVKSLGYRISKILLLDEFNSNSSGWPLVNSSQRFFQIENGRLYMENNKKNTSYWKDIYLPHRNILVRFDLRYESGYKKASAGIYFRFTTFNNDYRYYISVDAAEPGGYYKIGYYDSKHDYKDKWIELEDWSKTDAIQLNKNNVVEAIIEESNIYLYINGQYMTHVPGIENLSGSYIGFVVGWDSIKYSFDNLVVAELSK